MNYRREGTGPALVLVHGFLHGSGFWQPLIDAFSDRFDMIAPDLPGFAGSGHLPAANDIPEMARRVVDLLDSLGVGTFSLIGHSMGGQIIQEIALEYGPRLEKLVIYSSSSGITAFPPANPEASRSPEERQKILEDRGVDGFRRWMAPYWFADGDASPFLEDCLRSGDGCSEEVARRGATYMRSWDRTADLNRITAPTLVIGGDVDRTFSVEAMAYIAGTVADGELCLIPGAAHCAHFERADLFTQKLENFLAR